jgi:hypothetical protein
MQHKTYRYKDQFTVIQDNKGITVIEFDGPLCRKIDAFQIPIKGADVIGRAGIVIEGEETWRDFVAAVNTANEAFKGPRLVVAD